MLLRTRVSLIAVLALLAAAVVGATAGLQRAQGREEALAAPLATAQEGAWRAVVDGLCRELEAVLRPHAADPALLDAVMRDDARALKALFPALLDGIGERGAPVRVEVADNDRALLGTSLPQPVGADKPMLDAASLDRVLTRGEVVRGLAQDQRRAYVVATTLPLARDGRAVGALTVTLGVEAAVKRLKAAAGGEAAFVDLRNNLVTSTDAALWSAVRAAWTPADRAVAALPLGAAGTWRAAATPVTDATGLPVARLVTLGDATDAEAARERRERAWWAAGAAALAGLVLLAAWLIGRSFEPLNGTVEAFSALADGRPVPELRPPFAPEVGRLASALGRLGETIDAYEKLRRSRVRQGRRQARFIRQQMVELANTLDSESRDAVLGDLGRIEKAMQGEPAPVAAADGETPHDRRIDHLVNEFGLLALGFQNLISRVGEQYHKLDILVAELREALRAKTQYIALQQELEIARNMQLSILPRDYAPRPEAEVHARMIPAKEVGGDFYDFFDLGPNRLGIVVADVSGKGVPAAFFMAVSRTLLRATAQFGEDPGTVLARLNDMLADGNEQMMFVTLFYGILDLETLELRYANGGHNPPLRIGVDGAVSELPRTGGMALAVADGIPYRDATVTLLPGETLILFTDGVTEAFDIDGDQFGDARTQEMAARISRLPTHEIPDAMVEAIKQFERGAAQADDITCLAVRARPGAAGVGAALLADATVHG
ncbi:PP2C family protein-serine/threonine phosphatase [Azospirillum sp.]|uniref:PP2C family protein-serine/threonine phosphatase n=1 Tax=Azospirillum sp. TaxID=34012 RepID=UPI002D3E822D|nr:PP2C family protein-serine/threonine phosphatase [Azospirillum sp.]HYD69872.1 PP2C family protein-serine/threonine phosphatase [Azospirillum sp.]